MEFSSEVIDTVYKLVVENPNSSCKDILTILHDKYSLIYLTEGDILDIIFLIAEKNAESEQMEEYEHHERMKTDEYYRLNTFLRENEQN